MNDKKFGSFFIIKRQAFIAERKDDIRTVYQFDRKVLGQGSYGNVFRAKHRQTGDIRAVKVISKAKIRNKDRFKMEIDILKKLDHPNVIKLFETFQDHKYIYLVMEICTGGELFDRIKEAGCFTEKFAARVFKQIIQALLFCHKNKICHRDLKPENFLFQNKNPDSTLKVIDFGLSKIYDDPKKGLVKMKTTAGTPYYISPEVIAGNYNEACDLWSAGVIMYILLCGYPPFYGSDDEQILASVKKGKFSFEEDWDEISNEAKHLIKNLITSPEKRLTAEEALNHPWIKHQASHSGDKELKVANLKALRNFVGTEKLKKLALTMIASQCSSKEIQHLKEVFQALDANGDGFLSMNELESGMAKIMNPEQVQKVMQSIDTDKNGTVNYTEFLAATLQENIYLQEEKLRHAFNKFDTDGSGKISAQELAQVIGEETGIDNQIWISIIRDVDENGDGQIDFDEFVHMMRKGVQ